MFVEAARRAVVPARGQQAAQAGQHRREAAQVAKFFLF